MLWIRYILMRLSAIPIKLIYIITARKLKIGYGVRIITNSVFEGYNKIERFSVFGGKLGYGSYIGDNSLVIGKVGRFCSIAGNVKFVSTTHPTKKFVSSHPAFYSLHRQVGMTFVTRQKFDERPRLPGEEYSIIVGNDVYIGYGATIIGPVRIGDGAVIAANATVTRDVPPYSIVGGTPARELGKRFTEEEIEYLMRLKWWDKDEKWWKLNADSFEDIELLMQRADKAIESHSTVY